MTENNKKKRTAAAVLIIITLAFIWSNSLLNREYSTMESNWVLELFSLIFGSGAVSEHFIRKLAHFAEFAFLGAELYVFFGKYRLSVSHGLFAALADESLQMLSDRSAEVKDVLLDFSGVATGAAICLLIVNLAIKNKE